MNPMIIMDRVTDIMQVIVLAGSVIALLNATATSVRAPEATQNGRIDSLEKRVDAIQVRLANGDKHFEWVDEGSTIVQQCILAMIDAQISGDNIEELKKTRQSLYSYLSQKGAQ